MNPSLTTQADSLLIPRADGHEVTNVCKITMESEKKADERGGYKLSTICRGGLNMKIWTPIETLIFCCSENLDFRPRDWFHWIRLEVLFFFTSVSEHHCRA